MMKRGVYRRQAVGMQTTETAGADVSIRHLLHSVPKNVFMSETESEIPDIPRFKRLQQKHLKSVFELRTIRTRFLHES
ncbi:MAG: hypothetical protein K2I31_10505, partial [Duncaniella sp.]|nr:hypothetical protein [Duncaniella sp.]